MADPGQALQAIFLGLRAPPHPPCMARGRSCRPDSYGLRKGAIQGWPGKGFSRVSIHVALACLGDTARSALQQEDLAESGCPGGVPTCGPAYTCLAFTCSRRTRMRRSAVCVSCIPAPASGLRGLCKQMLTQPCGPPPGTKRSPLPMRSGRGRWSHSLYVRCREDTHDLWGVQLSKVSL